MAVPLFSAQYAPFYFLGSHICLYNAYLDIIFFSFLLVLTGLLQNLLNNSLLFNLVQPIKKSPY